MLGRNTVASGKRLEHPALAVGLAARVRAGRSRIGADRRDLHHARDALGAGGGGDPSRQRALDFGKTLAAGLVQDADQIDDAGGAGERAPQRRLAVEVGALHHDLIDAAQRLQMVTVGVRAAADDAKARAALGQPADDVAADEAGASEDREQMVAHRASLEPPWGLPDRTIAVIIALARIRRPAPQGPAIPRASG